MSARYSCGRCGAVVAKSTHVCPQCHAQLAGIRCQQCSFVGGESDFVNDHCPKCHAFVYVPPQPVAKAGELCPKCQHTIPSGEVTCPQCGYTQWGTVLIDLLLGLGLASAPLWGMQSLG
jgi:RNA polymerase subunit RPABC4/transcription elongation factor Spt4